MRASLSDVFYALVLAKQAKNGQKHPVLAEKSCQNLVKMMLEMVGIGESQHFCRKINEKSMEIASIDGGRHLFSMLAGGVSGHFLPSHQDCL